MAAQPMQNTLASVFWPVQGEQASILRLVVLAVAGTALLTLSAKLKVPFYPVPMTMQTLVVLVLGFWKPGFFVTTKLDVNKAQQGVQQIQAR